MTAVVVDLFEAVEVKHEEGQKEDMYSASAVSESRVPRPAVGGPLPGAPPAQLHTQWVTLVLRFAILAAGMYTGLNQVGDGDRSSGVDRLADASSYLVVASHPCTLDRHVMPPHFRNAQQFARLHPETFRAPTAEQLERVGPGSWVKVSVAFPENEDGMDGERFWVEVRERYGDRLVGRVDNELVATRDHGLVRNDRVEFSLEHVYDIDI